MTSEEIRQDMIHEARMCAEYAALGLWDDASRRAKSYKSLERLLRAQNPNEDPLLGPARPAGPNAPAT